MRYSNVKLYLKYNDIHFTRGPINEKYLSFMFLNENEDTLSVVKKTEFPNRPIRHYLVPNSLAPFRTYMNADYKNDIKNAKFIPIKANVNEISKFQNKHMYIDTNRYFDLIISRWNIKIFNNRKFRSLFDTYFNVMSKFIPDNNEKILLYTVNIDKPFNNKLLNKKILPLYLNILNNKKNPETAVPFDKIFYVAYSDKEDFVEYYLIYDKTKKLNISRLRNIITRYKYNENETENSEPVLSDEELLNLNDFDEKDIKHANNFSERYNPWLDGSLNILSENPALLARGLNAAWQGSKYLIRPRQGISKIGEKMVGFASKRGAASHEAMGRAADAAAKRAEQVRQATAAAKEAAKKEGLSWSATRQRVKAAANAIPQAEDVPGGKRILNWVAQKGEKYRTAPLTTAAFDGMNTVMYGGMIAGLPSAAYYKLTGKEPPKPPGIYQNVKNAVSNAPTSVKATAGVAALAGAGYLAKKYMENKKKEKWYETQCENLTGSAYQNCVNYVNQKKLDTAVKLKDECDGDERCMQMMQADIEKISAAMQQGVLSKG